MKELAPIVMFVYNRLWHTEQTISTLQQNKLADKSDLIIYSDGPKNENDAQKIRLVRQYLESITGFKNITIHESHSNKGLANSIIDGVTDVINKYGKIIVLEDDMVTSSIFLNFMNESLELYKNEGNVISIHGYIYPVKKELPDTFFIKGADCWGWATWKRGWDIFESDGEKLLNKLEKRNLCSEFDFNGAFPYTKMLKDQINGKNDSWAIRWYASAFLEGKLTLYPGKSLVHNIGLDGSGHHCGENDSFYSPYNFESWIPSIVKKSLIEDVMAKKQIAAFLKNSERNIFHKLLKLFKKAKYQK